MGLEAGEKDAEIVDLTINHDSPLSLSGEETMVIEGIPITTETRHILETHSWYNDEIINAHFALLQRIHPQHYFFTTFLFTKLEQCAAFQQTGNLRMARETRERLGRWTKEVCMGEKKKVFVPVNLGQSHWVLVVLDVSERTLVYYDSIMNRRSGKHVLDLLHDYLFDLIPHESIERRLDGTAIGVLAFILAKMTLHTTEERRKSKQLVKVFPKGLPQQQDGYSCGAFVCKYAECIAADEPLQFSQMDVDRHRSILLTRFLNHH